MSRDCSKSRKERREIALKKFKCINCFLAHCEGTEKCDKRSFCYYCRENVPTATKHSGWLCVEANNPFVIDESQPSGNLNKKVKQDNDVPSRRKYPPRGRFTEKEAASLLATQSSATKKLLEEHLRATATAIQANAAAVLKNLTQVPTSFPESAQSGTSPPHS